MLLRPAGLLVINWNFLTCQTLHLKLFLKDLTYTLRNLLLNQDEKDDGILFLVEEALDCR